MWDTCSRICSLLLWVTCMSLCTFFFLVHNSRNYGNIFSEKADKVDACLHQMLIKLEPNRQHIACLGNWVLYHTLQAMISYLLAGFELELYATYEYHYVYWYVLYVYVGKAKKKSNVTKYLRSGTCIFYSWRSFTMWCNNARWNFCVKVFKKSFQHINNSYMCAVVIACIWYMYQYLVWSIFDICSLIFKNKTSLYTPSTFFWILEDSLLLDPHHTSVIAGSCLIYCRYLYEMLYSWLINTLHRADNFLLENETMAGKGVQILCYMNTFLVQTIFAVWLIKIFLKVHKNIHHASWTKWYVC